MDMMFSKYSISNMQGIEVLLNDAHDFVKNDIIANINENPENCIVAEYNGSLVAVSVHTGKIGQRICSFSLFVLPSFRRQGIGTALLKKTLQSIQDLGIGKVIVDFEQDSQGDEISSFLKNNGLSFAFISNYMGYSSGLLEDTCVKFTPYEDKYYDAYYELESKAFYELRKANNIKPYLFEPSEASRNHCATNSKDYYLLFEDNKLTAAGYAGGDEIDHIAVDEDYRGRGYGRALVTYGVNKLLREGNSKVYLWVLDWNKSAVSLYKSIGFKIERVHEFYIKEF